MFLKKGMPLAAVGPVDGLILGEIVDIEECADDVFELNDATIKVKRRHNGEVIEVLYSKMTLLVDCNEYSRGVNDCFVRTYRTMEKETCPEIKAVLKSLLHTFDTLR